MGDDWWFVKEGIDIGYAEDSLAEPRVCRESNTARTHSRDQNTAAPARDTLTHPQVRPRTSILLASQVQAETISPLSQFLYIIDALLRPYKNNLRVAPFIHCDVVWLDN